MRKAFDRLQAMYETSLGQDVIETLVGAGVIAGGQAMFTDMSPEQIALSTTLGIGAGMAGRPIFGRVGQEIGQKIGQHDPETEVLTRHLIEKMVGSLPGKMQSAARSKLKPYAHLNGVGQLGALAGHGYGDNALQAAVAMLSPMMMNQESR